MEIAAIQAMIQSFATHALGLDLGSPIIDTHELPPPCQRALGCEPAHDRRVWCAWETDRGAVAVLARHDELRSALVKAHVLHFEWWIGEEHHAGWYYTYPKFLSEWTAGSGRPNRW